ncbi:hypothetical protein JYU34_012635 [Plutella xylostella]|uniref:Reverse transcriptase n=1 Tax=Plutella xylostella TaxID=51655 RepID=A0ABQ7QBS9_PLUXY|nr:hypothetical protein JYU34_012635 [Plutella xylostella]
MVLLSPSVSGLSKMLQKCEQYMLSHGMVYNTKKSEFMVFVSGNKKPKTVPPVLLNGVALKRVSHYKYLGHILTESLRDDMDIERERRALSVRCNMLARRFARSSEQVKITLFKAFCQSFYTSSLWVDYTQRSYSALRVQYNNAFRVLLRRPHFCSASAMFTEARTDGFHAIIRKRAASMLRRLRDSHNSILEVIADRIDCKLLKHWIKLLIN